MWWLRIILLFLFPFTLLLHQGSSSINLSIEQDHSCPPSSCGKISNITYPFRLKHDPLHCGNSRYELSCENNVTTLNLYSQKYYLQAINYNNFTIRLVDPGVQQDNCSPLPHYFLSRSDFCDTYASSMDNCREPYIAKGIYYEPLFKHIVYLNCSHRVTNNPKYVNTSSCLNSQSKGYIYAMAGNLIVQDFQVGCHVEFITPTSWPGLRRNKVRSYDVIHKALVYGFEISWLNLICQNRCGGSYACSFNTSTEELQCFAELHFSCYDSIMYHQIIQTNNTCDTITLIWIGEFFNLSAAITKNI
ncbi:hypothetical protein P8452_06568 [Trifolium repens]|nr:hypothetical protein P8452_06568 [Trifolium repens]